MMTLGPSADTDVGEASINYAGWRIVGVCFAMATFGWALGFYGQSVYLAELQRLRGWPASLVSGATTFFYLVGAVLVAFLSEAIRAFGPRRCLIAGVLALAGATIVLGQVETPLQLYGAYGLLAIGWAGTSLGAVTNTLGLWFDRKRGLAISLALNGASFGGIIGVPLMVAAIGAFGFPTATLIAAIGTLAVLLPAILLFVGTPPQAPQPPSIAPSATAAQTRAAAFRDRGFLTMTISFAIGLFAQVGFIVHLVSYLEPVVGRQNAAIAVSLMTAMAITGRLLIGTIIDRLDQRLASALSFVSQAIALIVLLNTDRTLWVFGACALFGFSVGNLITFPALILQREFDPRAFGVLVSLVTAVTQVAYAFAPAVLGVLYDATGNYTWPFGLCVAFQVAGALLILLPSKDRRDPAAA